MSRIGLSPINVPEGLEFSFVEQTFSVKNQNNSLSIKIDNGFDIQIDSGVINIKRPNNNKDSRSKHGLYRSLINNMFIGLSKGFELELELHGVGYRASNKGQLLELSLGYSHNIAMQVCEEVALSTESEKGKLPKIILKSHDKELIGMVAAKIKSLRKHDPYKGKGIRFVGERVRRKAGKTAS